MKKSLVNRLTPASNFSVYSTALETMNARPQRRAPPMKRCASTKRDLRTASSASAANHELVTRISVLTPPKIGFRACRDASKRAGVWCRLTMKDPNRTAKTVMSAITKPHTPSTPGSRRVGSPTGSNWVSVSEHIDDSLIDALPETHQHSPERRGDRSWPDHR